MVTMGERSSRWYISPMVATGSRQAGPEQPGEYGVAHVGAGGRQGREEQPTRPLSPWKWLVAGRAARSSQVNMELPMRELVATREGESRRMYPLLEAAGRRPAGPE